MKDELILSLLWKRAEGALDALARRFGRRLQATAMNILGSREDAEETVNDTYLEIWNVIPPKRPDPLAGFVYRVGRNLALDRLRHDLAKKRSSRYDVSLEELEGCIPGPWLEEQISARALGQAINRFLDRQPRTHRDLFLRRYWYGDSVQQIARDYEMLPNTVTVRLRRMRAQLREFLVKEGFLYE